MGKRELNVVRQEAIIKPDKSRVLIRPFVPGSSARIKAILGRIMPISDEEAKGVLAKVFVEFRNRHRDIESVFAQRFEDLRSYLPRTYKPSDTMRLLIGSYFTCEYSLEAAALFNPSIVAHPDQSGIPQGALRFILSLRATGEGHISSIEFRTGIVDAKGVAILDPYNRFVTLPAANPDPSFRKTEFVNRIRDEKQLNPITKQILQPLTDSFRRTDLIASIAKVEKKYRKLSEAQSTSIGFVQSLAELNYDMSFPLARELSERVVFPVSSFESNGIEDARFVRFADNDGKVAYYATYTAYNGRSIMPLLLETEDFARFRVLSMSGAAAKNKGMALFPRKIKNKYVMISRQDGENLYSVFSDNVYSWRTPGKLLKPKFPWEFTQIGNCGSPIETAKGWLLLTHGVGPVRKYCIGAVLLDLDDPSKVIGQLKEPLIAPDDSEREGYVPNVVYTCGAIAHNGKLVVPYAMSDQASRFATVSMDELLDAMK
jgi:predicted GH43/DUF377 family glycosyl hydrolase